MDTSTGRPEGDKALLIFHYIPDKKLAVISMIAYLVFMVYLAYKTYRTKSRHFLYMLPITALMEAIGYLVRISCHDFTSVGKYAIMQMLLLLAPNALALVNYKTVGEMIRLSNVENAPFYLRHKFVTWFFFWSDVFSFLMQGSGGGLQSSGGQMANVGKSVVLVGLFVQLVFLACFAVITFYVARSHKYVFYVDGQENSKSKLILCLGSTLILIYIRSIYRVAEYASGFDGPVARLEWAFYVFDTLAIAICFIIYIIFYIGHYLPKPRDIKASMAYPLMGMDNMKQTKHYQNV